MRSPSPYFPDSYSATQISHVLMSDHTGPASFLKNKDVLVLSDTQNINCSSLKLGYKASWDILGKWIVRASRKAYLHAFLAQWEDDPLQIHYFKSRGWTPYVKKARLVETCNGRKRESNADNLMLFWTGILISRTPCQTVIIMSGDGTLASDIAEFAKNLPTPRQILTMSLPGSTAWRLNAEFSHFIDGNIEIGRDCLRPFHESYDKSKQKIYNGF